MTTTTADLPQARLSTAFRLAPLALAAMLLSAECRADWKVAPLFDLRETYTDNVGQQRDDLARSQFITEASPGIKLSGSSPRLEMTATARWRLFSYSDKNNDPNLRDSDRSYQASGRAKLIDQLLYVDASASSTRQSVSAFGQLTDNPYSGANRADVSTWRISPYLQHRFGSTATVDLRYSRDSVDGAFGGFGRSVASNTSANLASGPAYTDLGWYLSYNRQELNEQVAGDSTSQNGLVGLRYRIASHWALTGTAGYDKYSYTALSESTSGPSWTLGFIWTPSTRSKLEASFGHRYFGKTGSLAGTHRSRHIVWNLNYSDQVTTTRSQFLLPASIDTAVMLDNLFSASYPDPVLRQQAVQAYIAATGLPTSLANSINYLSNRYIRAKQLRGAVILRGARSSVTFSLFKDQREALSLQQTDSSLLGSQLASLNDNVRQRGANISADYRLSALSSLQASTYLLRAQSLSTGITNNSTQLRLGATRRFGKHANGNVELRHSQGNLGIEQNARYRENAVAATLSVVY
jgi:uncharacterized protein (PEP-CTERM system associated)